MKDFLKQFKEFAMRGNVIDLAVAVVVGGAFSAIVTSLVNDIIMPLIGIILGGNNLANLHLQVGSAVVNYGRFLQSVVNFLIIAFSIFIAIRMIKKLEALNPLAKKAEETAKPKTKQPTETELLTEIRDLLKKNTKKSKK